MEKLNLILTIVGAVISVLGIYKFCGVDKVRAWLKYAVAIAEQEFGGGTGELKLVAVYNKLILTFPVVSKFIPYWLFKKLVNEALRWLDKLLDSNVRIAEVIKNLSYLEEEAGNEGEEPEDIEE